MIARTPLLVTALAVVASLASAQTPGVDAPPLPGPVVALTVPTLEQQVLPNGLRVVVAQRSGTPLVALKLVTQRGKSADPVGRTGLAQMTTELRTKGAVVAGQRLSASALAQAAESLGAPLQSAADWQVSTLAMTVATPQVPQAMALLAGTLRRPLLAADEWQRLRSQTADALQAAASDPMHLALQQAGRVAWGTSVYGNSLTPAALGKLQLADLRRFHAATARPDLTTLVATGDITLERAVALAKTHFGDWARPASAPAAPRNEPPKPRPEATTLVNLPGAGQSGVVVTAPTVADDAPERRIAQVATAVLGGGYSARLNTEVRIKRGLSYGARAQAHNQPVGGIVVASTQTKNPSAAEVVQVVRGELLRLGQDAPGADELAARQATLVGNLASAMETTEGLAGLVVDILAHERPLDELQHAAHDIHAVSADQVRAYAARQWTADALRTVVVGDLAAAGAPLKALDAKARVLQAKEVAR